MLAFFVQQAEKNLSYICTKATDLATEEVHRWDPEQSEADGQFGVCCESLDSMTTLFPNVTKNKVKWPMTNAGINFQLLLRYLEVAYH